MAKRVRAQGQIGTAPGHPRERWRVDKSINVSTVMAVLISGGGIIAGGAWWASSLEGAKDEIVRRVSASEEHIETLTGRVIRIEEQSLGNTEILKRIDRDIQDALKGSRRKQ